MSEVTVEMRDKIAARAQLAVAEFAVIAATVNAYIKEWERETETRAPPGTSANIVQQVVSLYCAEKAREAADPNTWLQQIVSDAKTADEVRLHSEHLGDEG